MALYASRRTKAGRIQILETANWRTRKTPGAFPSEPTFIPKPSREHTVLRDIPAPRLTSLAYEQTDTTGESVLFYGVCFGGKVLYTANQRSIEV